MSQLARRGAELRTEPRHKVPPMYTLLRVRPRGTGRYCWTGYIYDISVSGMRFDLDESLPVGTEVEVRAMLPGAYHTTIRASGHVVRLHDDEGDPGPTRMGLSFDQFHHHTDRSQLSEYLTNSLRRAA